MTNTNNNAAVSGKHRNRLERDREFLTMYRQALDLMLAQHVRDPRREAIRFTIHHSSPRYHVSYERAYIVVCRILNGDGNPLVPSLQAQMWQEIADRVNSLRTSAGLSIARALDFVLEHCRASRFFISENYAYTRLYPERKKTRNRLS
ncbi:MAG: hypothetical protein KBT10_01300 [Bacteroidales bacterium]|nr:hypothetical protein [Candidatus Sodaliphilus aphodohippi]